MTLQILDIVLYNAAGELRRIALKPGQVNIITGASKTGKSALSAIVDYCMGSDECHIPAGAIRRTVAWYGLRLTAGEQQFFVARPDPGTKKGDRRVYFEVATSVEIPPLSALRSVMNVETLVRRLTEVVGIGENLNVPEVRHTRPPLEATVRHALWFCFQAQGEVANQRYLFHNQGEQHIPQALKDVLPYFLGAATDAVIAKRAEVRRVRADLRELQRGQAERAATAAAGAAGLAGMLAEAQAAGVVATDAPVGDARATRVLLEASVRGPLPEAVGEERDTKLAALLQERAVLLEEQRQTRAQLDAARAVIGGQDEFAREAREQRTRLASIDVYPDLDPAAGSRCPVCDSQVSDSIPSVAQLRESLRRLSTQLAGVQQERPRFERLIAELDARLDAGRQRIVASNAALRALEAQDRQLAGVLREGVRRAHVIGRISHFLERSTPPIDDGDVESRARALEARIAELDEELSNESVQERLASALNLLGAQMTKWAHRLELEHRGAQYRLDLGQLTVIADTPDGPLPMARMGSAENWLGCHLIAHLALHKWFIARQRPVPGFLFLDQPTQINYPPEKDADGSIDILRDEDRDAVIRIFKLILEVTAKLAPDLQVVLTDHADIHEDWFHGAVRARWRRGDKLIPEAWLPTASGSSQSLEEPEDEED